MTDRNTLVRSMHDLGAAAWFGGSLMGAVGLNGASQDAADPADRARLAAAGWARWSPVGAAAGRVESEGGTQPSGDTPADVASAQRRLRVVQWVIPALTGVVVLLGAQQGEQQRPAEIVKGVAAKLTRRRRAVLPG